MVCISGGKDSFLLAKCMQELVKHGKVPFEAHYVCMNPGYNDYNRDLKKDYQLNYFHAVLLKIYNYKYHL